jgi:hypothetical protein
MQYGLRIYIYSMVRGFKQGGRRGGILRLDEECQQAVETQRNTDWSDASIRGYERTNKTENM